MQSVTLDKGCVHPAIAQLSGREVLRFRRASLRVLAFYQAGTDRRLAAGPSALVVLALLVSLGNEHAFKNIYMNWWAVLGLTK